MFISVWKGGLWGFLVVEVSLFIFVQRVSGYCSKQQHEKGYK